MWIIFVISFFSVNATEVPVCDNLFSSVDTLLQTQPLNVDATKKELFKIGNDKRSEMMRYVRSQKDIYRKTKELELTAFDVETKKIKGASSEQRAARRKERSALSLKVQTEKKEHNKNLDTQDKACQEYLKTKREEYLTKIRELQNATKALQKEAKKTEALLPPELEEFKEIPKGPGTVLKPQ